MKRIDELLGFSLDDEDAEDTLLNAIMMIHPDPNERGAVLTLTAAIEAFVEREMENANYIHDLYRQIDRQHDESDVWHSKYIERLKERLERLELKRQTRARGSDAVAQTWEPLQNFARKPLYQEQYRQWTAFFCNTKTRDGNKVPIKAAYENARHVVGAIIRRDARSDRVVAPNAAKATFGWPGPDTMKDTLGFKAIRRADVPRPSDEKRMWSILKQLVDDDPVLKRWYESPEIQFQLKA